MIALPAVAEMAFLLLVSFVLLISMRRQAEAIFGSLFHLIGEVLRSIPLVGGWLAAHVMQATDWIAARIGNAARELEAPIAGFFGTLAGIIEFAAFTTAYVAESTLHALGLLRHVVIPRLLHAATVPLTAGVAGARAIGRVTTRDLARLEATLERDINAALRRAQAIAASSAGAIAADLGTFWGDTWRTLRRRLSRVERIVVGGVLTGIIVRAITRRLPWFRCSNVGKTAKAICRTDTDLLNALLADTLILAGSISLLAFIEECQAVEGVLIDGLGKLVREFDSAA